MADVLLANKWQIYAQSLPDVRENNLRDAIKKFIFRNLRILTFRNTLKNFSNIDLVDSEKVIALIDAENKKNNVNLIVLNFNSTNRISEKLESFLVNLNKNIPLANKLHTLKIFTRLE